MEAYLRDKEFLTELCSQRERDIFARVTALDLKGKPIEQIESKVTGGSINIDGSSAVRRTCSLTMVTESLDINEYYWGFKTQIKIEIGLKNNLNKYKDKEIIWFNMGIYLISTFSLSQSTTGITINISGKDKMCQLNGEMGGILMAQTDFGQIESYDEFGNRTLKKIPIQQIITDMIHQYADEDFSKIIIEDIEDYGLNLQTYRGSDPCYLFLLGTEDGARAPEQIETNGNREVFVPCKYDEKLIVQRLYTAADGSRKIDDDEKQAILNIIEGSEVIEPSHAKAVAIYYDQIDKNPEAIGRQLKEEYLAGLKAGIEEEIKQKYDNSSIKAIQNYYTIFPAYVAAWRVLKYSARLLNQEDLLDGELELIASLPYPGKTVTAACGRAILNYGAELIGWQNNFIYENRVNKDAVINYVNFIIDEKNNNITDSDSWAADPWKLLQEENEYESIKENYYQNDNNYYETKWVSAAQYHIVKNSANKEVLFDHSEEELILTFIINTYKILAKHALVYGKYFKYCKEINNIEGQITELNNNTSDNLVKYTISIDAIQYYEKKYGILSTALEDVKITNRTPITLSNLGNQEFSFFFNPGNKLTNEEVTVPIYLTPETTAIPYYVRKIEYGSTIGYTITELVYPEDLIANSGETLTSVLDKIKTMLGDFEYFYDVDGNFIFRKQRAYKETYNAEDLLRMEIGLSYDEEYEDENGNIQTRTVNNDNSLFLIQSLDSNVDFEFKNLDLVTQISNNPAIGNVKNDYTVWGNKKGSGDNTIPIHMRYAIDTKPEEYHTIGLTPSRACLLLRVYPDIYPLQAGETEELAVRRLVAAHKARHFYSRVPARMKLQAETLIENYLIPVINKLANYGTEYPIDDDILDAAQGLIKTLQNMTIQKIDLSADKNYKALIYDFYDPTCTELQKCGEQNWDAIQNQFIDFVQSFNDVIDNLYDWRELIYQMAKDYRFFNQTDEFRPWLEEANPMTCIDGKTGYEQYYIDMEGFWRNIYDKEYHQVKWNDQLQEGTVYIVDDDVTEGQGTPILYNTEKIYYKDNNGNRILMPDFDIYIPAAEGEVSTNNSENSVDQQYKKIGTLYGIVKNNYKILEPVIERYVINEWMKTHPEMIYRLKGLHPNDEEEYINSHYLYMKDPMTWIHNQNLIKGRYAVTETEQLHGYQRPYLHHGNQLPLNADGITTFLSASKTPLCLEELEDNKNRMSILKSINLNKIKYDNKNNFSELDYCYQVCYGTGNEKQSLFEEQTRIKEYLKEIGKSLKLVQGTNPGDIIYQTLGLISLAMKLNNSYNYKTLDAYKSLIKKYFIKMVAQEIYIKQRYVIEDDVEATQHSVLTPDINIPKTFKILFNEKFTETLKNILSISEETDIFILDDFQEYTLMDFLKLIEFVGDHDEDKIFTVNDLSNIINDLLEAKVTLDQIKKYYKSISYYFTRSFIPDFLKELYFRATYDNSIINENYNYNFYSIVLDKIILKSLKDIFKDWNGSDVLEKNNILSFVNNYLEKLDFVIDDIDTDFQTMVWDIIKKQILSYIDFNQDQVFSLLDIQYLAELANENENLNGINDEVKDLIGFDGTYKATFLKTRFFLSLLYSLYFKEILEDESLSYYQTWILLLTPYAIKRTLENPNTAHRTPFYFKQKILVWSGYDEKKLASEQEKFYKEIRNIFNGVGGAEFKILCQSADMKIQDMIKTNQQILEEYAKDPNSISSFELYVCQELSRFSESTGDVNNDGKITAADARLAAQYIGKTVKEAKDEYEKEENKK